jgi:hypothetical protein
MTIKNLKHALLLPAVALTVFASALYAQAPQSAPKAAEIIQLAEKALGGEAFYNPRPYQVTISQISYNSRDGEQTLKRMDTYKDGKFFADWTITYKKRTDWSRQSKCISDLNKDVAWQTASDGVWEKRTGVITPDIPFLNKNLLTETLIFGQETPSTIRQGGNNYYKVNAKYRAAESSDYSATFLIDTTNYLIYNMEVRNTQGTYIRTWTYLNYTKVQDIAFPLKISIEWIDNRQNSRFKGKSRSEINFSNFTFRDDIPDSLFEVSLDYPAPTLPAPSKTYEFFTSYAHPEWAPPDSGPGDSIVDRLKSDVIDIVNNYPGRNIRYPEVLDKLARHLEGTLRTTGGRVERQEYRWRGDEWVNVIASYGPGSGPCIVIGAHYDAVRTSAAADDNASAVAVLLELARHLGKNPPNVRVDLAAYTLEEEGLNGSGVHAKALKAKNVEVKAMFSLEMVGYFSDEPKSQKYPISLLKLFYPSKGNFITVVSKSGSGKLVKTIKKAMSDATPLPVESFVASVQRASFIARSDHASFWLEGYPAVMITDTSEFRNFAYHGPDDVPERLDYRRMAMVAVGMMNAIKVLGEK